MTWGELSDGLRNDAHWLKRHWQIELPPVGVAPSPRIEQEVADWCAGYAKSPREAASLPIDPAARPWVIDRLFFGTKLCRTRPPSLVENVAQSLVEVLVTEYRDEERAQWLAARRNLLKFWGGS